jgi:hypothetical protein
MKTRSRPREIDFRLSEFSVEVSYLLTGRYRLVGQSIASHDVFEGDFWGETGSEFSHSLGRVEMWRGGIRFDVVCCRPFRLAVP